MVHREGNQQVRKLTDAGIDILLGREPAKILILSDIEVSPNDVCNESLADSNIPQFNIATPHRPTLVVTSSPELNRLIRNGNISALVDYFIHKMLPSLLSKNVA